MAPLRLLSVSNYLAPLVNVAQRIPMTLPPPTPPPQQNRPAGVVWMTRFLCAILRGASAWPPHGAACRTQETLERSRHCRPSRMVKVQSQGEAGPLGAQPLPRVLELAASTVAHVPA